MINWFVGLTQSPIKLKNYILCKIGLVQNF